MHVCLQPDFIVYRLTVVTKQSDHKVQKTEIERSKHI